MFSQTLFPLLMVLTFATVFVTPLINIDIEKWLRDQNSKFENNCQNNEVWRECAKNTEPTCPNQNPMVDNNCGQPRCQCKDGYFRDLNNKCVSKKNCPDDTANRVWTYLLNRDNN
uniref:TIL domain-containing protein n=1 Tax=Rhabditophanes sp. KR3021 TaxID=114890 RepID=A0AC35TK19_9BILA